MIFMLSASGLSLSNELSSVLLKVSHLVAYFINYFMWSTSRESPLKGSVGDLTFFRSHLSKFLSTVGSIFLIFCPVELQFLKFTSVLSQVRFICLL